MRNRLPTIAPLAPVVPLAVALSLLVASPAPAGAAESMPAAPAPEPGLYLVAPGASAPDGLVRLHQRMPDRMHQSGTVGMMLTQGMSKAHMNAELPGARAEIRTKAGRLEFYFRFGENAGKAPDPNDMAAAMAAMQGFFGDAPPWNATRPDEFELVRLRVEGEARRAETGSVGGRKGASGKSRDAVRFEVEKLGPHEFRVRTKEAIVPGEYGFYFAGQGPGAQIWDFGVDAE